MKSGGVLEAGIDFPGSERVVIDLDGEEGCEAGEEIGRDGSEGIVAEDEDLERGEGRERGEGTRNVVPLELEALELGQKGEVFREGALQGFVADLDLGDPFVGGGAGDEFPIAGIRVGPGGVREGGEGVPESKHGGGVIGGGKGEEEEEEERADLEKGGGGVLHDVNLGKWLGIEFDGLGKRGIGEGGEAHGVVWRGGTHRGESK